MSKKDITGFKDARPCTTEEQARIYAEWLCSDYLSDLKDELIPEITEHYTDEALLTDQPEHIVFTVLGWIESELMKANSPNLFSTDLAKLLKGDTGIELSNNAMKDALLMAGYEPQEPKDAIWLYCISMDSPTIKRRYEDFMNAYREKQNAGNIGN